jgi:peptide/nickel transport system ATP-binding protein/oligopeptide transport system ATP-binding protein
MSTTQQTPDATPLLRIRDLAVSFRTDEGLVRAVDGVCLDIRRGEVLGLVGESGCGKSVTAMSVLRLIPSPPGSVDGGSVLYRDRDLLAIPPRELQSIRGRAISMIFQEPMTALSPLHKIGDQLVEALRIHRRIRVRDARAVALDWLRKVGIPAAEEQMRAYPHQLSGGMRQRVMIAMAMMLEPELIIADEPTTALDVTVQAQVFDLMRHMKQRDMSVLLITHDMGVIWEMCSRVAVMYASEIVETGAISEVFSNPLHPYTEALLASIPSLDARRERLSTIPGQVPSPMEYPAGCRFQDRCPYVFDRCRAEHPALQQAAGREARCFLAAKRARPSAANTEGPA